MAAQIRVAARLAIVLAVSALGTACGTAASPVGPGAPAPTITAVAPLSASIGDVITITGTGFTATGNGVKLGSGYSNGLNSADTTTLKFTIPAGLAACPPTAQTCIAIALVTPTGPTTLSVVNANGSSSAVSFAVVAK